MEASERPRTLTALQRRVLGVLMEKSFTTPEQYPLTLNALVTGCNQKSNRDPVVEYTEGDVANTLQELIRKGLAKYADVEHGARANRFAHTVSARFPWSPREQAVMAELMLRGPQTAGELRSRADRMVRMNDLGVVQSILEELAGYNPPCAVPLPRAPGRSAIRYTHTFYAEDEAPDPPSAPPGDRAATAAAAAPVAASGAEDLDRVQQRLDERLDALERRVAALEARICD